MKKILLLLCMLSLQPSYSQEILQKLPILSPRIIAHLKSSYDRTGLNKDGSEGTNCTDSILHGKVNNPSGGSDGTYEYVLFSTNIPCAIKRFWLTDVPPETILRFYFDDEAIPSIVAQIPSYFVTDNLFTYDFFHSSGANISYKPIHIPSSLIITSSKNDGYYNIGYEQLPVDSMVNNEDYIQELNELFTKTGFYPKDNLISLHYIDTTVVLNPATSTTPLHVYGAGSIESISLYCPQFNYNFPTVITDDVNTHRGVSTFTMQLDSTADKFQIIRRTKTTMSTPTQNAQVYIDGIFAGNWNYSVPERNYAVWENTAFSLPSLLCKHKSSITISIKSLPGNNAYSEAYYWIKCDGVTTDSLDVGKESDEQLHHYSVTQLKTQYTHTSTYKLSSQDTLQNAMLLSQIYVSVFFDNNPIPNIRCPLGMFFGTGMHNLSNFQSLLLGIDSSQNLYNNLTAPYWENAIIKLQNNSSLPLSLSMKIAYQNTEIYDKNITGYLSNYYHSDSYASDSGFVTLLQAEGSGVYIGTTLEAGQYDDGEYIDNEWINWLEGDEIITIDDAITPYIYGTGTEDFFNGGFYFAFNLMSKPLYGMIYEDTNYFRTCYRYFISDPIYFKKNIHTVLEHGNWNNKNSFYKINSWYYHLPLASILLADSILPGDNTSRVQHLYTDNGTTITAVGYYEGLQDDISKQFNVRTSTDSIQFNATIPNSNTGLRILRSFYNIYEYQKVRVYIDDEEVGIWEHSGKNLSQHWRDDVFEIPLKFTRGKTNILIKLVPTEDTPLWTAVSYKLYAYRGEEFVNTGTTTEVTNISIYPNPTSDYIFFSNPSSEKIFYSIATLQGQSLFSSYGDTYQGIDVRFLPSGAYIMTTKDISGTSLVYKFIKL